MFPTYNRFCHGMLTSADLSQTRTSRLAGLDNVRLGPDQAIDCHEIFPHGSKGPKRSRDLHDPWP